jgi:hypothetical protein
MPNEIPASNKTLLNTSTAAAPNSRAILDDYHNEVGAAAELHVAPITLAIWRMQKKGPPVTRIGRRVLYKKSSLREWVASQEAPPCTVNPATA